MFGESILAVRRRPTVDEVRLRCKRPLVFESWAEVNVQVDRKSLEFPGLELCRTKEG
jgi:hypothetical protein